MRSKVFVGSLLPAFLFVMGALAEDYPIRDQADSLHARQDELVLTTLLKPAKEGQRILTALDTPAELDSRQWVLVKSLDGLTQEIHCIKSIRENFQSGGVVEVRIKLDHDLQFDYPANTRLIQGSIARERGVVGRLAEDAKDGKGRIFMDTTLEIDLLEQVVLQSPDGQVREAHCVRWIDGNELQLFDDLKNDYLSNSLVIQGGLINGEVEREDCACACPDKKGWRD